MNKYGVINLNEYWNELAVQLKRQCSWGDVKQQRCSAGFVQSVSASVHMFLIDKAVQIKLRWWRCHRNQTCFRSHACLCVGLSVFSVDSRQPVSYGTSTWGYLSVFMKRLARLQLLSLHAGWASVPQVLTETSLDWVTARRGVLLNKTQIPMYGLLVLQGHAGNLLQKHFWIAVTCSRNYRSLVDFIPTFSLYYHFQHKDNLQPDYYNYSYG